MAALSPAGTLAGIFAQSIFITPGSPTERGSAVTESRDIDPRQLRDALGHFATGVTVVTTRTPDGRDEAITVNSFASVSLDPPLVLWSIDRGARSFEAFTHCDHFAIHVLGAGQQPISNRFASKDLEEKFDGTIPIEAGINGVPLLTRDYCARFQCITHERFDGGDHVILVGRVLDLDTRDNPPLIFHGGRYRILTTE